MRSSAARRTGPADDQMIMALVQLNPAEGHFVEDLSVLEGDKGFCRILREVEDYGLTGSERRALLKRRRKDRTLMFPSPTAAREYLELFHDPKQ